MKTISPYVYPILKHYLLPEEYLKYKNNKHITREDVICAILTQYKDSENFLSTISRKRKYVEPKKIYCKLCLDILNRNTVEIASDIVNYDHSVVIYSKETFNDLFESNYTFKQKVIKILNFLAIDEYKLKKTTPQLNEKVY